MENLNPQTLAADPGQSVWVSANAGTGKTRVLIDRITRLLLDGTKADRILCLTFTKAAAAEMGNRLNDRLGDWAASKPKDLNYKLHNLLERPPTPNECIRARQLFAEIIDAPDGLKVRTIHAFCESLLGRFSLEAGVAPNFQVIDERRGEDLRIETQEELLHGSLKQDSIDLAQAMAHIAGLVDEVRFAEVMTELDASRGRLAILIGARGSLDALIEAGYRALGLEPHSDQASIINAAVNDTVIDNSALNFSCNILLKGSKSEKYRAAQIKAWLQADRSRRIELFFEHYLPIFLTRKRTPRAPRGLMSQSLALTEQDALPPLLAEQERLYQISEILKAIAVAENTAAILTIGNTLLEAYERLKRLRGLLDYDDLIAKAAILLSNKDGVSWVHYKLDGGIDHILVDEAQDTSQAQWQVISELAGDFFSGAGRIDPESSSQNRTIFAVGDEKQSIYSFQGADPSQFRKIGHQFSRKIKAAKQNWRPVEIAKSWRSTSAILNTVDYVFETSIASDGLTWTDQPISHQTVRHGEAGRVELWPMTRAADIHTPDPWDAPLDQIPADDPRTRLANTIAETVNSWLTKGEILESRDRLLTAGDIMILVRTRGPFADEMVRALKNLGIPVAGSDRMILTEYLAVMDMIALGRFALLPDDDLNTATVLKGPFIGLNETQLSKLACEREGSLWDELNRSRIKDPVYRAALGKLRQVLSGIDFQPPFEFFNAQLINGGRQAILSRLGAEAADPIDEFMSLALDFERDHIPSLEGFLHWIETGKTEVKRDLEQEAGAVRIMTIHGAKGLQAPIVFLADNGLLPPRQLQDSFRWNVTKDGKGTVLWPGFRENEVASTEAILKSQRLETEREYRRLLYVAMTRAEDRLYVTGWRGKRDADETCWHKLIETGLRRASETIEIPTPDGIRLRFDSGEITRRENSKSPVQKDDYKEAIPLWASRTAPKHSASRGSLSPSILGQEPTVASPISGQTERFNRGRILHTLFKCLPDIQAITRPKAMAKYLAEPAHGLSKAAQLEIASEVIAVLNHPELSHLFGLQSRAEVPIVGAIGDGKNCVISGQVDRILITEDTVTVIDFKTNQFTPEFERDVPTIYLRQMAAYRKLLSLIYAEREIISVLLWTDGPKLMRLSDKILDFHAP